VKIGDRILILLNNRGITQKEFASEMGIARTTLNGYINNHREPDYDTIIRISKYFGISVDYLIGASNDPDYKANEKEETLLESFRLLHQNQKEFLLEQMKIFIKQNNK